MDRQTNKQTDLTQGWMNKQMHRWWTYRQQTDGPTNGWTDRQVDGGTDKQMYMETNERMNGQIERKAD